MLTADVDFSDFDAPADLIGGSVVFGRSRIEPFAHRLLRAQVFDTPDRLAVACIERFRDDPKGIALTRMASADLGDRLAAVRGHLLDWAILIIDRVEWSVTYQVSRIHCAPVYVRDIGDRLLIDWDSERLLGETGAGIAWPEAMTQLAGTISYGARTLVDGVHRSIADATLRVANGRIDIGLPASVTMPGAQALSPTASPTDLLFETMKLSIAARDLDCRRTAIELSGGMDSALVALAAAAVLGPGMLSYGAQFDGAMGDAQRQRRLLVSTHGGFEDFTVPAGRFAPFGPASARRHRFGVWPQDENYPELFEAMLDVLVHAGIDTLTCGYGGDELYAIYDGEGFPDDRDRTLDGHPFLTSRGQSLARQGAAAGPRGILADTSSLSAAARAQRLLRRGIWPIYPYLNPDLARFVASLPLEFRRDRMLLRRALTKQLGDPVFETDYVKESFREVALSGIEQNRAYLQQVVERSPLIDPDLVRGDRLASAIAGDVASLPDGEFGYLFLALTMCCFFDAASAKHDVDAAISESPGEQIARFDAA